MIYLPTLPDKPLENIGQWNIFGWSVVQVLDNSESRKCADIQNGLVRYVGLSNINGKYLETAGEYKNAPVYWNGSQTLLVSGGGYNNKDFNSLGSLEQAVILSDIDDNANETYTIYRDGPYLLGKFNNDDSWAIIKLPSSLDTFTRVNQLDFDLSTFSDQDIEASIVVAQVKQKPPLKYKSYNANNLSKNYLNWQNKVSPLSRDWEVNLKNTNSGFCIMGHNRAVPAKSHFTSSVPSVAQSIERQSEKIPRSKPFVDIVYDQFNILKNVLTENNTKTAIFFPPVMYNMVIKLDKGESDLATGTFPHLGYYIDANNVGHELVRLNIIGKFINNSNIKSILNNGKYVVDSVEVIVGENEETLETITVNRNSFVRSLDRTSKNLVYWAQNEMTRWCSSTAFLYQPPLFISDWIRVAETSMIDLTDKSNFFNSKYTNKYYFYSYDEVEFFDRLYEYMQLKG